LFASSAMVNLETDDVGSVTLKRLGDGFLKIRVRMKLTADGGESVMAV